MREKPIPIKLSSRQSWHHKEGKMAEKAYYGTGRRKSSTARVWMRRGRKDQSTIVNWKIISAWIRLG